MCSSIGHFSDGTSCLPCGPSNCKTCSTTTTCDECNPNHLLQNSNTECNLCSPIGNFVTLNPPNEPICSSCIEGCTTCLDSISCLDCDTIHHYHKTVMKSCFECNTGQFKYFRNDSTPACLDCESPCLQCFGAALNCTECLEPTDYFLDPVTSKGTCLVDENAYKGKCHDSCKTCLGAGEEECLSCFDDTCLKISGQCVTCPSNFALSEASSLRERATLNWAIRQHHVNNASQFYFDFSEDEIFLMEPIDIRKLENHIQVKIYF